MSLPAAKHKYPPWWVGTYHLADLCGFTGSECPVINSYIDPADVQDIFCAHEQLWAQRVGLV